MKDSQSAANMDFSEYYDQECDIYYVTFKTGEPSFVMEVDDVLLVEVGMFTGMPTGFRILNFAKHKARMKETRAQKIEKALDAAQGKLTSQFRARRSAVQQAIEKVLA
jgi:hypothetical protein